MEAEETQSQEEGIQTEEVIAAEESDYNEPAPERWPEEYRDYYNQLDPKGKEIFLSKMYKPMQGQYTKATQELAGMRKTVEPMLETLNKHKNTLERMGVNPQEAFNTQMAWIAHIAENGPAKGLADMQRAYGLNSGDSQGQTVEEYLTPMERQLRSENHALKGKVDETSDRLDSWQEQQNRNAQNQHINGVKNDLTSFINEQKNGKPAHPHIEKVAPAIAGIIKGGLIKNTDQYGQAVPIRTQMSQAYEMACRLDPSISTANSSVRQVTSPKNATAADVVANNPSGQANVPKLTMEQEIDSQYDKLRTRG